MSDKDLIKQAALAWHNEEQDHITIPIYSTDGTPLLELSFYKEGHEWVGRIAQEDMVELVRTATVLRKRSTDT